LQVKDTMTTSNQNEPIIALSWKGLSLEEVNKSRHQHGANVLTPPVRDPWWKLFLEKFDDPVIRILMIAAALAIVVGIFNGKYYEGIGIIAAILLATVIAFVNEFKAGKEFEILNRTSDQKPIKALRDGHWMEIERKDLVVGDIIQLDQGYEVPADGVVLDAMAFQVDQSTLTGESLAVPKAVTSNTNAGWDPKTQQEIPDFIVCRGTQVAEGNATIRIEKVGDGTLLGRLGKDISENIHSDTPLDQQLEKLSKWIGVVGFSIAAMTFIALAVRDILIGAVSLSGQQWVFMAIAMVSIGISLSRVWLPIYYDACELLGREVEAPKWLEEEGFAAWGKIIGLGLLFFAVGVGISYAFNWIPSTLPALMPLNFGLALLGYFMIAVTIIVVAVPEGLAMSVTLSLAYSMRLMMKTGTLVRKMSACETIGATTVICSDKTGTLTKNKMHARELVTLCSNSASCGKKAGDKCVGTDSCTNLMLEAIAANTTAHIEEKPGMQARSIGNPTEGALLLWISAQGFDYNQLRSAFHVEDRIPFDTKRKFMATIGTSKVSGKRRLHMKGAPETVLEHCTHMYADDSIQLLDAAERARILQSLLDAQKRGFRTLGFAYRDLEGPPTQKGSQSFDGLVWLRFAIIEDPIREEVPSALAVCNGAGIETKIVTGDHPETATEVARQLGLLTGPLKEGEHISGKAFGAMSDEEATEAIKSLKILSRALPEHKERLVRLLRTAGHVVAVTGDGVNDGPAMKHSSVALAMGSGTDLAKECSQVILLNDSFATITSAVMWGRTLYENIQRFIVFQLTVNVAALGVAFLGPFIGVAIPLTVIQLLWVNLIMDTFAALALATEPPHLDTMNRNPRKADAFIVTNAMSKWIFGFGGTFLILLLAALLYIRTGGVDAYELSVFFAIFVMLQFWNLFNARCFGVNQSAFIGLFNNKGFLVIATAIFFGTILMIQTGGEVFRTQALPLKDWIYIITGTSFVLWIGELIRFMGRAPKTAAAN